ncbi:MAG TPA: carbohydrate ABC transporter permease [Thermomicrobiales bacterium]|nr:carbohydrate ABC transporter permease [Thermomicrobiales bacterium]
MTTLVSSPLSHRMSVWRKQTVFYAVLVILLMAILLPIAWAISTALKSPGHVFVYPPEALPRPVKWRNFADAWSQGQSFTIYFKNSLILTVFPVIGQVTSCSLVAYGFARFRFPLRNVLFMLLLATLLIPPQVTLIPQFILFRHLNWINTFYPLIVPSYFATSAFSVFLLRQFFMTIPRELDEAALVDGSSYFRIFFEILLPLLKPALIAVAIIGFFASWNDFLGPLIYLSSPEKYPLALGLNFFLTTYGGGVSHMELLMAASLITLLLPLAIFVVAQRYFVEGIAMTGIRG